MDSFDNLYCRSVIYLQESPFRTGKPTLGIGDLSTLRLLMNSSTVTAVMLIMEEKLKMPQEAIKTGRAIKAIEAVELRPESLSDAVVSWIVFAHEEVPSTLLIHKGVNPEDIKTMCFTKLMREVPKGRLNNTVVNKAREIAGNSTLTQPEPLEDLLKR